jgi:hypothetical protein
VRADRERHLFEIIVLEGFISCDSSRGIISEESAIKDETEIQLDI